MMRIAPHLPPVASLPGLSASVRHCPLHGSCGPLCAFFPVRADPYTPPNLRRALPGLQFGLYSAYAINKSNMLVLPDKLCDRSGVVCIGLRLSDRRALCVTLVSGSWSDFGKSLYACVCACMCVRVCVSSIILGFFCVIADQNNKHGKIIVIKMVTVITVCRPNADHCGHGKGCAYGN